MRELLRKAASRLPEPIYEYLRLWHRRHGNVSYFRQGLTTIRCGSYELQIPKDHLLVKLRKQQPYRDLCIGITAKFVAAKRPDASIVDVGANIGDTAAIIANYVHNKLILVEASDYFFGILTQNARQFTNELVLKRAMVASGRSTRGNLQHWGGTAHFQEEANSGTQIETQRLEDIAGSNVGFVKIDTDGFDVEILRSSLDWLKVEHPAVLFENQIRNEGDEKDASALFDELGEIGYIYFVVWDDAGFRIVSTTSRDILKHLNLYLLRRSQKRVAGGICNLDVLCLHEDDADIYREVSEWFSVN